MNNRHIIGPNINNCLSGNILRNIELFNHSPTTILVIGRPIYRIASVASSHLKYKIQVYETVTHLCQSTDLMVNSPLLLSWCIAITGYWISSIIIIVKASNNQLLASYRQKSNHYQAQFHQQVKIITNKSRLCITNMLTLSMLYAYCSMHKEWFNLWLYYLLSCMPAHTRSVMSCIMWNLL